MTEYTRE